jgi:hypothetical protein
MHFLTPNRGKADLTSCQNQGRTLNGPVKSLQRKGQLVAPPVGRTIGSVYIALSDAMIVEHPILARTMEESETPV